MRPPAVTDPPQVLSTPACVSASHEPTYGKARNLLGPSMASSQAGMVSLALSKDGTGCASNLPREKAASLMEQTPNSN